ncbi:MAG: methionyl-tRNA formyltransferase [Acetobacteraceae bacterium]|nr:methionyl-tRNA formyltransferase [Acetobacteraceae bacterium]
MRLAFFGTAPFAVPALRALYAAGHDIRCVYTQPPRKAGRGFAVQRSAVHEAALRLGLRVETPERLTAETAAAFAALGLDVAVVAAYGLLLPPAILSAPARGCLNIHASLLPRWRGAAPIQAAILAGDTETGVSIMQMEAGLDTGPVLLAEAVPIGPRTTAAELHDQLAELGARLILRALAENPKPVPQPQTGVTYAKKLTREDGRIDWTASAEEIDRRVRALNPWPGTFTTLMDKPLKILAVSLAEGSGAPGVTLDDRLTVACGRGALRLERVQLAGGKALTAADFLRGHPVPKGTRLH